MKWIDYREKLGIGFEDEEKFGMLKNKVLNYIEILTSYDDYSDSEYCDFCYDIGCRILDYGMRLNLLEIFEKVENSTELISIYIAFYNNYSNRCFEINRKKKFSRTDIFNFIVGALKSLNIAFNIVKDDDGAFIFPKGAEELDEALVSAPLQWLMNYPKAHNAFIKALKDYSNYNGQNASDIADKFRKALEAFFQEFFGGSKSLENYLPEYGNYLKENLVPKEISNNFQKILESYTNFNNNYAKHHDKTTQKVLEYIMYETGNIIRLLITLKNN